MDNKIGIVFIHGAGLNSSIWKDLEQKIDAPILSVDFPNRKLKENSNTKLTFDVSWKTMTRETKKKTCHF